MLRRPWWVLKMAGLTKMSETERPKPEYGEYASDAEYAAALARSGAKPTSSGTPSSQPVHISKEGIHAKGSTAGTPTAAISAKSAFDRLVTVFLLSFGAVSILGSAGSFLSLKQKLPEMVAQLGMGAFHATAQTATMGIVMFVSQVLLWAFAAVWSFRRIRRQKLSWWVPVLFGVVSFVLLSILLGLALSADPSFVPKI